MKKTKSILALILAFMLLFALCGCGEKKADETEPATEAEDYSGIYTAFGVKSDAFGLGDSIFDTTGLLDLTFTLNADGTGKTTSDDETASIKWKVEGEKITITNEEDEDVDGTIKDGVMEIAFTEDGVTGYVYLAKSGVDTSSYNVISLSGLLGEEATE